MLREVAQCPPDELERFQDTTRHKFFNTNNLWLRLRAVKALIETQGPVLKLPMIRNVKPIDPRQTDSPKVYQLETAMGAAIQLFEGATAIRVPRTRLAPVKTTGDLLKIRSDAYQLTEGYHVVPTPGRKCGDIVIELDSTFYWSIDNMDARFPHGAPSLIECERLEVRGDIKFGRNVRLVGNVRLINESAEQLEVEDGALIDGHANRAIRSERWI